jgi:hypothetical protein
MTADHYDVMVDDAVAAEAMRILDGGAPAPAAPAPGETTPPPSVA